MVTWWARLRLLHSRVYPAMPAANQETNSDLIETFVVCLSNKVTADRVWNRRPDTYALALNYANDVAVGHRILNQPVPPQPAAEAGARPLPHRRRQRQQCRWSRCRPAEERREPLLRV